MPLSEDEEKLAIELLGRAETPTEIVRKALDGVACDIILTFAGGTICHILDPTHEAPDCEQSDEREALDKV